VALQAKALASQGKSMGDHQNPWMSTDLVRPWISMEPASQQASLSTRRPATQQGSTQHMFNSY